MEDMRPRIVVLDAFTTSPLGLGEEDPSHPSWQGLADLGEVVLHARTKPEEVPERAAGAPVVLTNKVVLGAEMIRSLPDLRYIGLMSTGTNVVDLDCAREQGVTVTNVPAYAAPSAAQHAIALMLELALRLSENAALARSGVWSGQSDFCITSGRIIELAGRNFGIVGCGEIAQATARVAHALGMRILVFSRTHRETPFPAEWVDRDRILADSDVLSLHCPLTPETRHFINRDSLARMKPGALLINTGRGPLVNEGAVADALHQGRLGGYGADVTESEPPPADNPLFTAPRAVVTPHCAWASTEARTRLMETLVSNLQAFVDGHPVNTV